MTEIWKDIKGYEGLYQVSSLGRVKSLDRIIKITNKQRRKYKSQILKNGKSGNGYFTVALSGKSYLVHRLVAEAFIPNPDNKREIDHINTDRTDNTVVLNEDGSVNYEKTNLRWCTPLENSHNKLSVSKRLKPIVQLSLKGEPLRYFDSEKTASEQTGINYRYISRVAKGEREQTNSMRFMLFEDYINYY